MIAKIRAHVRLKPGMRVLYSPLYPPDDFKGHRFDKKYSGSTAVVRGFDQEYVAPLDTKGRWPGAYAESSIVNVCFEGEKEVFSSDVSHLIVLDACETIKAEDATMGERIGDLPYKLRFYPGDRVRKRGDKTGEVRFVENVRIHDKGVIVYALSESTASRNRREKIRLESGGVATSNIILPQAESSDGKGFVVASRGNVYDLYCAPEKLSFTSDEQELAFWAQDGVSRAITHGKNLMSIRYEWPLEEARRIVAGGGGDFVIKSREYKNVVVTGRKGTHQVRELHGCFAQYRERVRAVAARVTEPPVAAEIELSMNERTRRIVGIK